MELLQRLQGILRGGFFFWILHSQRSLPCSQTQGEGQLFRHTRTCFLLSQDMHGDATFFILFWEVCASCPRLWMRLLLTLVLVGVGVELSCSSSSGCSDAPPLSFFLCLSTSGFKIAQELKKRKEKTTTKASNQLNFTHTDTLFVIIATRQ